MEQMLKCNFRSLIMKYNGRHRWPMFLHPLQYGVANVGKAYSQYVCTYSSHKLYINVYTLAHISLLDEFVQGFFIASVDRLFVSSAP